jgi:hypothetical protein
MCLPKILFITIASCLALTSRAQETNTTPLYTSLEVFEAQVDTMIVKGSAPVGTVTAKTGVVSVWYKESRDAANDQKAYGAAIGVKDATGEEDITILDYDEMDSFLASIDFLMKINIQVTPLPGFIASYTSKAGLKISAYTSNKHSGAIPVALQSNHDRKSRVVLEPDQLERLKILVQEAKAKLDSLQEKKPNP